MIALIERLKKEWHVIKGAPFSFLIVCSMAIGFIWGGFRFIYHDKLAESEKRSEQWKSDADYWKDMASRPKQATVVAEASTAQIPKSVGPQRPHITLAVPTPMLTPTPQPQVINAAGGIPITGGNVSNPTVINNAPPPAIISYKDESSPNEKGERIVTAHLSTDRAIPGAVVGIVFSGPVELDKDLDPKLNPANAQQMDWGAGLMRNHMPLSNSVWVRINLPSALMPGQDLAVRVKAKTDVHVIEAMPLTIGT